MNEPNMPDATFQSKIGDSELTAIIDWAGLFTEDSFATGFKAAGDLVVDALAAPNIPWLGRVATSGDYPSFPDQYFFPVAYLYRHCIELLLKALIRKGEMFGLVSLSDEEKKLYGKHDLDLLWKLTREVLKLRWPGGSNEELDAAERRVLHFHELDRCGQEFRYPHGKDGRKLLANAPPAVNLQHLMEVVGELYDFLSGCIGGFDP